MSVLAVFFLWLLINNSIFNWWQQTILFSFTWGKYYSNNLNLKDLLKSFFRFLEGPFNIWSYLPIISLGIFIYFFLKIILKKTFSQKEIVILFLTLIGLTSWHQYYPIIDPRH